MHCLLLKIWARCGHLLSAAPPHRMSARLSRTRPRALVRALEAAALYRCWSGAKSDVLVSWGGGPGLLWASRPREGREGKGAPECKPSHNVRSCRPSGWRHLAPAQGPSQRHHGAARCSGNKEGYELQPVQGSQAGCPLRLPPHLEVVVHARAQHVFEGSIDPAPSPAVHIEHLQPKADCVFLALAIL